MKNNWKKIFSTVLIGILFLSTMTFPKAETTVESLGNEEVLVEVSQEYNTEEKKETVQLNVTTEVEGVTVKGLEYPDGSYEEQTTGTYTYEVTENAENVFKVKYVVQEEELLVEKEYEVTVTTSSIEEVEEVTTLEEPVVPLSGSGVLETDLEGTWWVVRDGDLEVRVLGYDPDAGWKAGVSYQVKVITTFSDENATGKKVTISLPEGMKYTEYFVFGATAGTPEAELTGVLASLVSSVSKPTKNPYYGSYNGDLEYNFNDLGVEKVTISFLATPDTVVYYGPKTFTDGISVSAEAAGTSIGDASIEVNAIGEASYGTALIGAGTFDKIGLENSDTVINVTAYAIYRQGEFYGTNQYYKEAHFEFYYPAELNDTITVTDSRCTLDTVNHKVDCLLTNESGNTGGIGIPVFSFNLVGVSEGIYTAASKAKVTVKMYDDTEIIKEHGYFTVTAESADSVTNQLTITGTDTGYYPLSENYQISGPRFEITNGNLTIKTDQWLELEINATTYEVSAVKLPTAGNTITTVYYKTNFDSAAAPYKEATGSQLVAFGPSSVEINKTSLSLAPGEYITHVKYQIGDVNTNYASATGSPGYFSTRNTLQIIGKLASGIDSANVTVKTYASEDGVTIESGSENELTRIVTRLSSSNNSLRANVTNISIPASETKKVTFLLDGEYNYTTEIGTVNPKLYIELLDNVTYKNIEVKNSVTGTLSFTTDTVVSEVTGKSYLEISITGYAGGYFDEKNSSLSVTMDIEAGIQAKGSYKWMDIAFWDFGGDINGHYKSGGMLAPSKNILVAGDTLANVLSTTSLTITAKEDLIIDTYIVPEGESRQPGYDGTTDTAVGFTPGTVATYTVEIFNNLKETVTAVTTYIPVPKEGNDYGYNFQGDRGSSTSAPFHWNMKLDAVPVLKVYDIDGNDITTSKGSNYVLSYSSTATTEANYEGATYGSSFSDTTTMIKVVNTTGIDVGEKAVITFEYVVDETTSSVENTDKLGSINEFQPFYRFSAASSGSSSGTKVGAILQIGAIGGQVFVDKDYDGVKNNSDTWLASGTVELYKMDGTLVDSTTIGTDGKYSFEGLASGSYYLNFNGLVNTASGSHRYFTFTGTGSQAAQTGANTGLVVDVDPTKEASKVISVGILEYDPSSLTVSVNNVTVQAGNAQNSGTTASITTTLNNSNFDKVKATSGAYSYVSNATGTATVNSGGVVTGVAAGSTTVTITVTDIFGNTKTGTSTVTVTSNNLPVVTVSSNTVTLELGQTFTATSYITGASDVEDTTLSASDVVITGTPNVNAVGSFSLTYRLTDTDGNYAEEVIVFTVADTTAPVINSVTNTSITFEYGDTIDQASVLAKLGTVSVTELATYTTSIDGIGLLNLSLLDTAQSVNLYATDASSNQSAATVISITIVDTTAPTISVGNTTVYHEVGTSLTESGLIGLLGTVTKSDNYSTTLDTLMSGFSGIDTDTVGSYTVQVYTKDSSNNESSKVTVTVVVRDTVAPVIDSVTNSSISFEYGETIDEASIKTKIGTISVTETGSYTTSIEGIGDLDLELLDTVQTVNLYATDAGSNKSSATVISITISDTVAPVITSVTNTSITFEYGDTIDQASVLAKLGTVSVTELATYTTSIDGIGLLNLSLLDTAQSVNLYATDASSNQSAATVISITIVDTTAPTISVENSLLVHPVGTSLTESELIGLLGSIVKNDNYTVVGLLETEIEGFSSVDTDTVGAYAVDVYTVDESGNESEKVTITINVVDEETPVISVDVSEVTYTVGSEVSESQFLSDIGLVVVDNYYSEEDMTITTTFSTVDLGESAIGTVQLVTVTVTDPSGNSTSITIQVHVIRKIVYYIEGENITIHYNDLQEHVNNGVLENKLIELTSAKAWQDCPQTGITDLPVYVKDLTPLMNAKGGETIQLELSLVGSSSMSARLVSNTTEMEELVHVVTIIVEAPSNVGSPTAPSTGVSQTVGIAGFGVIVSGLLLVLASKLKRKENI